MAMRHAVVNIGDQVIVRPGLCVPHGQVVLGGMTIVGEGVAGDPSAAPDSDLLATRSLD